MTRFGSGASISPISLRITSVTSSGSGSEGGTRQAGIAVSFARLNQ